MTDDQQTGRWPELLKKSFGRSFWVFVVVALAAGALCYFVLGPEVFAAGLARDRALLADFLPRVAAAQVVAGFVWVLVPRDRLSEFMQHGRGGRGLVLATAAGAITPGGPASAFPFLAILAGSGADRGILVAYITSWALLGIQRIIVWDIPLMGIDFSMLRLMIGAPLPMIAGLMARRIRIDLVLESTSPPDRQR